MANRFIESQTIERDTFEEVLRGHGVAVECDQNSKNGNKEDKDDNKKLEKKSKRKQNDDGNQDGPDKSNDNNTPDNVYKRTQFK